MKVLSVVVLWVKRLWSSFEQYLYLMLQNVVGLIQASALDSLLIWNGP